MLAWKFVLEETQERYYIERTRREAIKRRLRERGQDTPSPWYPSWAEVFDYEAQAIADQMGAFNHW
jgi:hypothetical protein